MRTPRSVLLALLVAGACGRGGAQKSSAAPGDTLNERQRDSLLSTSRIPGAHAVGAAMRAADSTSARIRATDSVTP